MGTLYLVRHGEAHTKLHDTQRPLTDQGKRIVERMAAWAAESGITVDQIRHSGILRAEQTADIFARHLNKSEKLVFMDGLRPNDDVHPVAAEAETIQYPLMLVGHLPFLGRLASRLVAGNPDVPTVSFQTASLVALQNRDQIWSVAVEMSPENIP